MRVARSCSRDTPSSRSRGRTQPRARRSRRARDTSPTARSSSPRAASTWRAVPRVARGRADADERRREAIPQREAAARRRDRRGASGAALRDGSAGECRKLTRAPLAPAMRRAISLVWKRTSSSSKAAIAGTSADAVQGRKPPRARDLPHRRAPRHGQRVPGAELEPLDLGRAPGATSACSPPRGGVGTTTARRSGKRRPQLLPERRRRRRPPDLDVDDSPVARELQHARHRRARDPQPVGYLLLGELVLVVELGGGEQRGGRRRLGRVLGGLRPHDRASSHRRTLVCWINVQVSARCAPLDEPVRRASRDLARARVAPRVAGSRDRPAARLRARLRGAARLRLARRRRPARGRPAAAAVDHDADDPCLRARRPARAPGLRAARGPRPRGDPGRLRGPRARRLVPGGHARRAGAQ